ncbi:MAG TPA: Na+/H+ antiporter NhaA [Acidimicrobiia bacterium]|nr:Na+/H+ antiporter NhaA [Acidimicrobiia bacterium]
MDSRHRTWATSERFVPKNFIRPFVRFSQIEASSGIVLLIAAIAALIWANSAWSDTYFSILEEHITIEFFGFHLDESVLHLINDALMAIFFFVVGLEIKRELVLGDLRDPKAAALPVMAALGGMVLPALIYFSINAGTAASHGWGIPMATDIAFAVGIVALLGSRVPSGAKLFLLAVAIADDIGAIAVIAIFYTSELNGAYFAAAVAGLLIVWIANKVNIRAMWFYVPVAIVIWYFTLESGIHATLAGVALGFLTPAYPYYEPQEFDQRARAILDQYPANDITDVHAQEHADHEVLLLSEIAQESVAPLTRMEHRLVAWSSFVIVPLFALANAGVDFRGVSLTEALTSRVALGVSLGLVVGKLVGISLASYGAVRLGLGKLPPGTSWSHVFGLAAVAGIGFTVSLFVAGLAFEDPVFTDYSKVGIFSGSLIAGLIGAFFLSRARPRSRS